MQNTEVNLGRQTQLPDAKPRKVPKPFSIESLIASHRPAESENVPSSDDKVKRPVEIPSVNSVPPTSFSTNIAAAAVAYNPWIHNYLMHQKFTEQFLDFASSNIPHAAKFNAQANEMVSQSAFDVSPVQMQHSEPTRGLSVDRESQDRLLKQYMNNCDPKISGMFAHASEFYKSYNSFSGISPNVQSDRNAFMDANRSFEKGSKTLGGDREVTGKEGSESDELNENDMESDCSSEVSLNLSRDGENDQQGIRL